MSQSDTSRRWYQRGPGDLVGDLRYQMIDAVAEVFAGSWFDPPERGVSEEIVDAVSALLDTDYFPATLAGLLGFLDRHYPADVFNGTSGDPGAHIVALTRAIAEHRTAINNAGSIEVQPGYEEVAEAKHRADERLWKVVGE